MTSSPLPNAIAAVTRARAVAAIARRRAPLHPSAPVLLAMAELLDTVASAFNTEPPQTHSRVTTANLIFPSEAWRALYEAEIWAAGNPTIGFPPEFGQYIVQPLYGNSLDLPEPLNTTSPVLATQEARLTAALRMVHHQLAEDHDAEAVAALLEAAFALTAKLDRLAQVAKAKAPASTQN